MKLICTNCGGLGYRDDELCTVCEGEGAYEEGDTDPWYEDTRDQAYEGDDIGDINDDDDDESDCADYDEWYDGGRNGD